MTILNISEKTIRGGIVLLPCREYESLLKLSTLGTSIKKLPKGIRVGLEDVKLGRIKGPFYSVEELRRSMAGAH